MSDWLHNLPTLWMALLVFGFTYLITAAIYAVVALFVVGERARSFKAVSPSLLSPLGVSRITEYVFVLAGGRLTKRATHIKASVTFMDYYST